MTGVLHDATGGEASNAVQITIVVPIGKREPDGGVHISILRVC